MILLDTNILIYASDITSPFHAASKLLRDNGLKGETQLSITPQVLLEFFAVVTSQKRTANPIEPQKALEEIEKYFKAQNIFKIYPNEKTLLKLIDLERKYSIKG
ncbi:MAG: PIN domain-containing protein [Nitrospirae bacterium]|nr:PIN domain-containing protein [Nitrospirota bacterium]MBF0540468.1 PIN domain-containing protein [Nitrospirota bacterium]